MENMDKSKFIDPEKIISQLGLREGCMVADFGCGTGYFSFVLARKVGEKGIVYSLDVLPQIIEAIKSQAKLEGIKNIVTKRVNLEKDGGSGLDSESLDWVILKDVLYQNKKKDIILQEAQRVLKKGGRALIVEWKKENAMLGPKINLRVEKNAILELAKNGGWEISTDIDTGRFHYGFVLIK